MLLAFLEQSMAGRESAFAGQNKLLASLPPEVSKQMEATVETVSFRLKDVVYEADQPIRFVYFPLSGMLSLVITMKDGGTVEVGTIGNEGMVGFPVFLGSDTNPLKIVSQVPGDAVRMPVEAFKKEIAAPDGILRELVAKYVHAMMNQVSHSAACNHLHTVEERMCRWLLMTHDRVGNDQFPLTQEFLAQMLGVRRPTVTIAAGLLEKAGLITYTRGHITVLDRHRLEAASCECYGNIKRQYDRLLAGNSSAA